jgi:hypothetical protein
MNFSFGDIETIITELAPRYVFPGADLEDIKQEAWCFALELLKAIDVNGHRMITSLVSLKLHLRNRLIALKFQRTHRSKHHALYGSND